MRGAARFLATVGCIAALSAAPASAAPPASTADLERLSWLVGDWETEPGPRQADEHWTHVAGSTLFGVSRTVAGDRTTSFEYLRIEAREDGIFYVAQPGGRSPGTAFRLVRLEPDQVVFENPAHDFPKRILYRRISADALLARVEGDGNEREPPQEFHFRRRSPS